MTINIAEKTKSLPVTDEVISENEVAFTIKASLTDIELVRNHIEMSRNQNDETSYSPDEVLKIAVMAKLLHVNSRTGTALVFEHAKVLGSVLGQMEADIANYWQFQWLPEFLQGYAESAAEFNNDLDQALEAFENISAELDLSAPCVEHLINIAQINRKMLALEADLNS